MRLHRLVAQDEALRDLVVREALGEQAEDLLLARRERRQLVGPELAARAEPRELGDQAPRDRGREERVARGDDPDGVEERLGADVLEQEAAGARLQRVVDVLVEVERREDEDPRSRLVPAERRAPASPRSRPSPACGRPSARRPARCSTAEPDRLRAVRRGGDDRRCPAGSRAARRSPRGRSPGRRRRAPGSRRRPRRAASPRRRSRRPRPRRTRTCRRRSSRGRASRRGRDPAASSPSPGPGPWSRTRMSSRSSP